MTRVRDGIGLPAVLAVLAVSAVVSIGVLTVGLQRGLEAHDAARWVHVNSAAESAVRVALAHWDADSMRAAARGASHSLQAGTPVAGGPVRKATAERVGPNRYIIRGEASIVTTGTARAQATALATVVMIPTHEIWRDFYPALGSAGGVGLAAGASVSGIDAGVPAAWSASDCPPGLAALVVALLGGVNRPGIAIAAGTPPVSTVGASVAGQPPVWVGAPLTDTADFMRLGPLSFPELRAIADRSESGSLHVAPAATAGKCDTHASGNWGNPADPADPCFGYVPLIHADAGLEVTSGTGQGVLVVEGDVVLRSGVDFTGLILATGRVDLDGATVTGAVRAGMGSHIDGILRYSACAIGRILDRAEAFRKPFRYGERLWLPAF